jgi:hypothetical protein
VVDDLLDMSGVGHVDLTSDADDQDARLFPPVVDRDVCSLLARVLALFSFVHLDPKIALLR